MTSLRDKAERALVTRLLADRLLAEAKILVDEVAAEMSTLGADRLTVKDPTSLVELGKLTQNSDRMAWDITDPDALKRWVAENRPEHLATSVHPAYAQWVLKEAEANDGVVGDPETGKMIPGLGKVRRIGTFTVTKSPEAKRRASQVVEQMLADGLPALPSTTPEGE